MPERLTPEDLDHIWSIADRVPAWRDDIYHLIAEVRASWAERDALRAEVAALRTAVDEAELRADRIYGCGCTDCEECSTDSGDIVDILTGGRPDIVEMPGRPTTREETPDAR